MALSLLVFVSSPGDVGPERDQARRVLERLQGEFGRAVELQPYCWEDKPQRATSGFQQQIIPPSQVDIVVCILWTRLGTPLSEPYYREDGTPYRGTEWEFEDAARSYPERGKPDLLVYRKTANLLGDVLDVKTVSERWEQKRALDAFCSRWFDAQDGTFKGAYRTFETLDEFDHLLETHLRELVLDHLARDNAAPGPIEWHEGSPYRGLEVFEAKHAPVFFGRTLAIGEIKYQLILQARNGCAFLLIFGMSGCGKSSLLRAGILPSLTKLKVGDRIGLWRVCIFRPGDAAGDLLDGLAAAVLGEGALPELAAMGFSARALAVLFRSEPQEAVARIAAGLDQAAQVVAQQTHQERPPEMRLAVAVDQLEELFTRDRMDAQQRDHFAAVLDALACSGRVWVIATMRSDFYHHCAEIPALAELKKRGQQYDLAPPTPAEIRQIIVYPARAAGLQFAADSQSGESLDDVLHAAAASNPTALPLLEFTLDALYQRCPGGVLTFEAYRQLGGLEGALAQHAEQVFRSLEPPVQAALPALLRALVTVGHDAEGLVGSRRVPAESLSHSPTVGPLLTALIQARLLVTDRTDDGTAVVGMAHEALLRHWPRVQTWLADDREFLRTRARIEEEMALWQAYGRRPVDLLTNGKPLNDAEHLVAGQRADLPAELVQFVETSQRHADWAHRRRWFFAGVLFLALVGTSVTFRLQWRNTERQKERTLQAIYRLTDMIPDDLAQLPRLSEILSRNYEQNLTILSAIDETRGARRARAVNLQHLGDIYLYQHGKIPAARVRYEQALKTGLELLNETHDPVDQRNLAVYWSRVGEVCERQNDLARAQNAFKESLKHEDHLAKGTPNEISSRARANLPARYIHVGDIILRLAEVAETKRDQEARMAYLEQARGAYASSLRHATQLSQTPEGEAESSLQRDLIFAYERLGWVYGLEGKLPEAFRAFQASLRVSNSSPAEKWDNQTRECIGRARLYFKETGLSLGLSRNALSSTLDSPKGRQGRAND